jgi:hypothetical protein
MKYCHITLAVQRPNALAFLAAEAARGSLIWHYAWFSRGAKNDVSGLDLSLYGYGCDVDDLAVIWIEDPCSKLQGICDRKE